MALVLKECWRLYHYFNDDCSDPRMLRFPLMANPFPMIGIVAVYLLFVFKVGPAFMKNRKPFKLNGIIQVYNIIQVLYCFHLVQQSIQYCYLRGYSLLCEPVDFSDTIDGVRIARGVYLYWIIKVIDLLDTVFFILRKKQNQVTFLHVYHHAGMVAVCWHGVKYYPGGHSVFMGTVNSFVHVVMYSYYFLTSWNAEYKNNIWWKKYITQLQLIQFFLIICHFGVLLFQPDCDFPKFSAAFMIPQNLFMLILFGDFYRKAYMKKKVPIKLDENHNE